MNITKEFLDYMQQQGVEINSYLFKCEIYSPIHKCNQILHQISDTDKNISQIQSMSKKTSSFNDKHLKFANATEIVYLCEKLLYEHQK